MKFMEMDPSYLGGRIMVLMHHFKLNKNSLSQKLGLSGNSLIGKIVNEPGRGMTTDLLSKFAGAFPSLNLRWLVTGEGDMFKSNIDKLPHHAVN